MFYVIYTPWKSRNQILDFPLFYDINHVMGKYCAKIHFLNYRQSANILLKLIYNDSK